MQVSAAVDNKNYIQNTYETLKPLNRILKLFSFNYNTTCAKNSTLSTVYVIVKSVLTATILGSMNLFTLYWKILYIYKDINVSIKLTDIVQMIYDIIQYAVDLTFVYKYGRDVSFQYFKQYGRIDCILGMTYYTHIRERLLRLMGFFAFMWITSSLCDFGAWVLNYGWITPLLYSIAYVYLLIKILTTLDLISQVMHVECRLRVIGDLAQYYYTTMNTSKLYVDDNVFKHNCFNSEAKESTTHAQTLKHVGVIATSEIQWLSKCYLLLTEQTAFINKMYGMRILLNSLSLLIDMVRFTNITVRLFMGFQQTQHASSYIPAIFTLMRLATCVAVVVCLVDYCEQAYRQRERVLCIIDHILINKDPGDDDKAALKELRDLMQSRPITFHMANFFRFDYSLLVSIASVVVTYTIIILQNMN